MIIDSEIGEKADEGENYFVSMTDMMVGMLFIFVIMLVVFAVKFRSGDDDSKQTRDCLISILAKNAKLTAEITEKVNRMQSQVHSQLDTLRLIADQRRALLTSIEAQLVTEGLSVEVDAGSGVLRLTEESVRFATDRSDLDLRARENVGRIARVLGRVVPAYACRSDDSSTCKEHHGATLETIFIEGHTDITGDDRKNWQLSTERAVSTFQALVSEAPDLRVFRNRRAEEILSVSGYSSARPLVSEATRAARGRNRRIDLRFVMEADTSINLNKILILNDELKAEIARLATASQESEHACQ